MVNIFLVQKNVYLFLCYSVYNFIDASMLTSCIHIFLRLASKCLNCTRSSEISKANEILSSSFERENRLKLCQATWTTHTHGEKFNKMLKNWEFYLIFIFVFAQKIVWQFSKIIRVYF